MTNYAIEMYNYHNWANQTILERIQALPPAVLSQDVNTSFPTIAHGLSHMLAVDTTWYQVVSGTSMPEAVQACMPLNGRILDAVEDYILAFDQLSVPFAALLQSHSDLELTIDLDNPYAGSRRTRLSEIVLHVVNHGTYHRGNLSTMLRQLGHASAMNDYALYWYQDKESNNSL
ncbi:DinB family protein [Paenibacillus methanolicus]|uniref:Putative damage-inducible protein DinB n=1 Tax=Paenibacillus methanolicus TaxID=582686 RepID=A0A5S5CID1_9BACL|nr:DinB family protein [Paenibacillus methanolicus]TYP79284.1 putative damage-inducible protein DinB [Paenibacillus methanolicus]